MSSMANINDSKRRHCKFTVAWCLFKEFSSWLIPVKSQNQKAYCLLCCRVFSVSHSGLHDVKAHWKGKKHCFLQKQYSVNVNDSLEQYDIKAYSLIFNEELNRTEELVVPDGEGERVESCELRSAFDDEVLAVTPALYCTSEDDEEDNMVKSATGAQQYCLRWKYHHNNLQVMFIQLLQRESFCDVTLACEGKMLRAHKVVLSACSTYFDKIFSEHEEKDPVVILKDCKFVDIKALVEFMYKGEINVENSHLNSLLKTAEELKIKGLADVSGKGLPEDDDSITYAPAPPPPRTERRPPAKDPPPPPRDYPRDPVRDFPREPARDFSREQRNREEEYDFDPSLLENSVSINVSDGSDIEEGTSQKAYSHHGDENEYMESNNEHNFSTLISHLQDYRTVDEYASADREREREREREQRELHRGSGNPYDNPVLAQFSDVIKMNDYLTTGRRQQFWEEPFTRRLMEAIKNKEIEMKAAAELMGVSYGTLYGRYRDAYGCLKHPYRTKDFWAEQGPAEILSRLQKKEITLFRAAEMLNVTVTTLANYLTTLRYEKNNSEKSEHDDEEEMDVNDSTEVYNSDPVPSRPKIDKAGNLSMNAVVDGRLLGLHDEEM